MHRDLSLNDIEFLPARVFAKLVNLKTLYVERCLYFIMFY